MLVGGFVYIFDSRFISDRNLNFHHKFHTWINERILNKSDTILKLINNLVHRPPSTDSFWWFHWMSNRPNGIEWPDLSTLSFSPAMKANLNESIFSIYQNSKALGSMLLSKLWKIFFYSHCMFWFFVAVFALYFSFILLDWNIQMEQVKNEITHKHVFHQAANRTTKK